MNKGQAKKIIHDNGCLPHLHRYKCEIEEVPIDLAEAVIPHHQWQPGIKATTTYCVSSFVISICVCVCAESVAVVLADL